MIKRITAAFALAFALTGATGSPAHATPDKTSACAAYVYKGTTTNLCVDFPGSKDRDCGDIKKPVELVKVGVDPWNLNRDTDRFGCDTPPPSGSASPSASASASASPSASASASSGASPSVSASASAGTSVAPSPSDSKSAPVGAAGGEPALPLTGPSGWEITAAGIALILAGMTAWVVVRRRQTRFTA